LVFSTNTCAIRAAHFRTEHDAIDIYADPNPVGASSHLRPIDRDVHIPCQCTSVPSAIFGPVDTLSDSNTVGNTLYSRSIEYTNRPPNRAAVRLTKLVCAIGITVAISPGNILNFTSDDNSHARYQYA